MRASRGLPGVREAARKDRTLKFTALLHHASEECLREAFFDLKKTAAVGVDEVTWHAYERNLEERIADLHGRVHRGAYRAKPSKRIDIPKPDGRHAQLSRLSLCESRYLRPPPLDFADGESCPFRRYRDGHRFAVVVGIDRDIGSHDLSHNRP